MTAAELPEGMVTIGQALHSLTEAWAAGQVIQLTDEQEVAA